jgi:hypothetical protein
MLLVFFGYVRNLPRHQFGNFQAKMFPAYFKLLIVCCSICVSAMATTHPWKTATKRERLQIVALGVSLFTVVVNLLVFQPLTIKVRHSKFLVMVIPRHSCIGFDVKKIGLL